MHFFNFDLIRQPELPDTNLFPAPEKDTLLLYLSGNERRGFLFSILKAAGYDQPEAQIHLLPVASGEQSFDLFSLVRHLEVKRVIVFGISPSGLGLRLQLGPYVPVQINGCWLLLADDLDLIRSEKEEGKSQKAGLLWKAIKARFMK